MPSPSGPPPTQSDEALPVEIDAAELSARQRASKLAREEFPRGKHPGADGRQVPVPTYAPEDFIVEKRDGRWLLRNEPPAGAYAIVSFGPDGEDAKVEVGFATH